jgi:D-3-phosphoglycerate dehydrogenase
MGMTKAKVAVTTSSFGEFDRRPIEILYEKGVTVVFNEKGKTLKSGEIPGLLQGCRGVIAGTEIYDAAVLDKLQDLRVISRCGAGTDNVDLDICQARGIKVFNTPDGPTRAVAELVIGLMLDLLRNISAMDREVRNGAWHKRMGRLFLDKEIGIVGFGRIGKEVARMSHLLGAKVFYFDPFVTQAHGLFFAVKNELKDLLSHCDAISLHLPFGPENRHLIGEKEFTLMKENAILINCSRGGIVDENALYAALKAGRIAGAAIDVFNEEPYQGPLQTLGNVILTPHIGSYAQEARVKMELEAVENLIRGLGE